MPSTIEPTKKSIISPTEPLVIAAELLNWINVHGLYKPYEDNKLSKYAPGILEQFGKSDTASAILTIGDRKLTQGLITYLIAYLYREFEHHDWHKNRKYAFRNVCYAAYLLLYLAKHDPKLLNMNSNIIKLYKILKAGGISLSKQLNVDATKFDKSHGLEVMQPVIKYIHKVWLGVSGSSGKIDHVEEDMLLDGIVKRYCENFVTGLSATIKPDSLIPQITQESMVTYFIKFPFRLYIGDILDYKQEAKMREDLIHLIIYAASCYDSKLHSEEYMKLLQSELNKLCKHNALQVILKCTDLLQLNATRKLAPVIKEERFVDNMLSLVFTCLKTPGYNSEKTKLLTAIQVCFSPEAKQKFAQQLKADLLIENYPAETLAEIYDRHLALSGDLEHFCGQITRLMDLTKTNNKKTQSFTLLTPENMRDVWGNANNILDAHFNKRVACLGLSTGIAGISKLELDEIKFYIVRLLRFVHEDGFEPDMQHKEYVTVDSNDVPLTVSKMLLNKDNFLPTRLQVFGVTVGKGNSGFAVFANIIAHVRYIGMNEWILYVNTEEVGRVELYYSGLFAALRGILKLCEAVAAKKYPQFIDKVKISGFYLVPDACRAMFKPISEDDKAGRNDTPLILSGEGKKLTLHKPTVHSLVKVKSSPDLGAKDYHTLVASDPMPFLKLGAKS